MSVECDRLGWSSSEKQGGVLVFMGHAIFI